MALAKESQDEPIVPKIFATRCRQIVAYFQTFPGQQTCRSTQRSASSRRTIGKRDVTSSTELKVLGGEIIRRPYMKPLL